MEIIDGFCTKQYKFASGKDAVILFSFQITNTVHIFMTFLHILFLMCL